MTWRHIDVELNDVNGGSFRIYVKHKKSSIKGFPGSKERIEKQKKYEEAMGLNNLEIYGKFAQQIEKAKGIISISQTRIKERKENLHLRRINTRFTLFCNMQE